MVSLCNKYQIDMESLKKAVESTVLLKDSKENSTYSDDYMIRRNASASVEEPGLSEEPRKTSGRVITRSQVDKALAENERLLLTWMVNRQVLFKKLEGIISADDFRDENVHTVAKLLHKQYEETGQVSPASIIDKFDSLEKQQVVAKIMNTELSLNLDEEDERRALNDIVKKVKANSLSVQILNPELSPDKLMSLMEEKRSLDRLEVI